jgi:hypothetical protein
VQLAVVLVLALVLVEVLVLVDWSLEATGIYHMPLDTQKT